MQKTTIKLVFKESNGIKNSDINDAIDIIATILLESKIIRDKSGKSYSIIRAECEYADLAEDGIYASINIYLSNYDAGKKFLYLDDKIEREIQELMAPIFYASFSEAGLQGEDYVSFDVGNKS